MSPGKYLLFGSDQASMQAQFIDKFSSQDWKAYQALQVRATHTGGYGRARRVDCE